jgi:uncharacterized protein YlxP (DUF503 family)
MIIGFLLLDIHLPLSHSLKEKRKRLNKMKDRFKNRFNVALAELEYQDKWQRAKIGIVTISTQRKIVENLFNRIIIEADENIDGEILDHQIHFF